MIGVNKEVDSSLWTRTRKESMEKARTREREDKRMSRRRIIRGATEETDGRNNESKPSMQADLRYELERKNQKARRRK